QHRTAAGLDQNGGESVRDVDGADDVDLQNVCPVARRQVPEGEAEFAAADRHREGDVVDAAQRLRDLRGRLLHRRVVRHVRLEGEGADAVRRFEGAGGGVDFRVAVEDGDGTALGGERLGDG